MRRTEQRGYVYPDEQDRKSNDILKAGLNQVEMDAVTNIVLHYYDIVLDDVWIEYYFEPYSPYDELTWWGSEFGDYPEYQDMILLNSMTGQKVVISSTVMDDFVDGTVGYVRIEDPYIPELTVEPQFTTSDDFGVLLADPRNIVFVMRVGNTLIFRNGRAWNREFWEPYGESKNRNAIEYSGNTKIATSLISSGGGEETGSIRMVSYPSSFSYYDHGRVFLLKMSGDGDTTGTEIYFYEDAARTKLAYSKTGLNVFTDPLYDIRGFFYDGLDNDILLYWKIVNNGATDSSYEFEIWAEQGEDY